MAIDTTIERLPARLGEQDRSTLCDSAALVADWLLVEPDRYFLLHGSTTCCSIPAALR